MTTVTEDKLRATLTLTDDNVSATARTLGVTRVTVYKWMKRYGITIQRSAA